MASKAHHSRPFLRIIFPPIPRDYLSRRRRFRNITNVLLIALFSLLLAGAILYTSSPAKGH